VENAAKITVSLPAHLLHAADEIARQEKKPRSGVISEALALFLEERERQEMIRGYKEMAEMSKALAEESVAAVNEVWARYD
jgi:CopG family transcriptional regulator / antitoxin EndoAI